MTFANSTVADRLLLMGHLPISRLPISAIANQTFANQDQCPPDCISDNCQSDFCQFFSKNSKTDKSQYQADKCQSLGCMWSHLSMETFANQDRCQSFLYYEGDICQSLHFHIYDLLYILYGQSVRVRDSTGDLAQSKGQLIVSSTEHWKNKWRLFSPLSSFYLLQSQSC